MNGTPSVYEQVFNKACATLSPKVIVTVTNLQDCLYRRSDDSPSPEYLAQIAYVRWMAQQSGITEQMAYCKELMKLTAPEWNTVVDRMDRGEALAKASDSDRIQEVDRTYRAFTVLHRR